jgi:hypothetical protein
MVAQVKANWGSDCGNLRRGGVARAVDEAREGQVVARSRSAAVEAQGIGAGEAHRDAVVDEEGKRRAEAGHLSSRYSPGFSKSLKSATSTFW